MTEDHTLPFSHFFPLTVRVEKGVGKEREQQFTRTFRIGRSSDCDFQLLDPTVSREHAKIQFEGRQWWVQDLQSKGGTFLNGIQIEREPISEHNPVKLKLGSTVLSLSIESLLIPQEVLPPSSSVSSPVVDPIGNAAEADHDVSTPSEEEEPQPVELVDDWEQRLVKADQAARDLEQRRKEGADLDIPSNSPPLESPDDPQSGIESQVMIDDDQSISQSTPLPPSPPLDPSQEPRHEGLPAPDMPLQDSSHSSLSVEPPEKELAEGSPITPHGESPGKRLPPLPPEPPQGSLTEMFKRALLDKDPVEGAEPQILAVKRALIKVLKLYSRKYQMVIGVAVGLSFLLAIGIYMKQQEVNQKEQELEEIRANAVDRFSDIKEMKLQLARLNVLLSELAPEQRKAIVQKQKKLQALQHKINQEYEKHLNDIGIYSDGMDEIDRLILRMSNVLGESEVEMPEDFKREVKQYIGYWQSTGKFEGAVQRANKNGYGKLVREAMLSEYMVPQMFYVALKESGFDVKAVGPQTHSGFAKGAWQFVPATAKEYGLKTGPLVLERKYDPRDERHNFKKATGAAAKYMRWLYTTEAQASGLLVMASYNWGPTKVRKLINKLPPNPRDRNFWQLLKRFKVPKQTRDYVLYIFSAAVIGENPKLFGFDLENPLKE